MRYSKDYIKNIIDKTDISDLISQYVPLTRRGKNLFGTCPFHGGKTPTFTVSPNKKIFYCFSCKKGGSAIQFIMSVKNISYVDSIKYLALIAGIEELSENAAMEKDKNESRKNLDDIINDDSDCVKVFSVGSCNPQTRLGKYNAKLVYKSRHKKIAGEITDTTTNRCIITGIIESIKLIKKPCRVVVVTSTAVGIHTFARTGKGTNADILKELLELLDIKQCDWEFIDVPGEGEKLNKFVTSYM